MADGKPPAFQFYAQDYLMGTMTMSLSEKGAYADLLAHQWDSGAVPGDDITALARMMRCSQAEARRVWPAVSKKFERGEDGLWRNARLERERLKQQAFRERQSENGRRGGRPKSNPNLSSGLSQPQTKHEPTSEARKSSLSSSSSTPPSKNDGGDAPKVIPMSAPITARGHAVAWDRQQQKLHAGCLPELCLHRGTAPKKCFPAAFLATLAGSVPGLTGEPAQAFVIAWAKADVPPSDWSAPAGDFDYWKERWDMTRPKPANREDRRAESHLAKVAAIRRGEYER